MAIIPPNNKKQLGKKIYIRSYNHIIQTDEFIATTSAREFNLKLLYEYFGYFGHFGKKSFPCYFTAQNPCWLQN